MMLEFSLIKDEKFKIRAITMIRTVQTRLGNYISTMELFMNLTFFFFRKFLQNKINHNGEKFFFSARFDCYR